MTFSRTLTTEISAPIDRVYALVSDLRCHPQWAHNQLTVQHLTGPETGLGAEYACTVEHPAPGMSKPAHGSIRITEDAGPHRFGYECHDDGGDYRWTFDLSISGRGTTVHHTVRRLAGPSYVKAFQPIAWRAFGENQVRSGLANLKRLAEQPVVSVPRQATAPAIELPVETTAPRT